MMSELRSKIHGFFSLTGPSAQRLGHLVGGARLPVIILRTSKRLVIETNTSIFTLFDVLRRGNIRCSSMEKYQWHSSREGSAELCRACSSYNDLISSRTRPHRGDNDFHGFFSLTGPSAQRLGHLVGGARLQLLSCAHQRDS